MSNKETHERDCKTCAHAHVQYERESDGRFSQQYTSSGYVRCSAPRYKGRWYFLKEKRGAKCADHQRNRV